MTDGSTNTGSQGSGDGHNPNTPPQVDLSPIDARINRITEAVSSLTRRERERDMQSASERLRQYEGQLNRAVEQASTNVDAAERVLARAHEEGDGVAIARATREVTDAVAQREAVRLEKREFDRAKQQQERRDGGSAGARGEVKDTSADTKPDTSNLNDWKKRNGEWYGVDTEMTKAAHEIDRTIREAGVIPVGSQEYFKAIDRQMANRYPDKLRTAPDTSGGGTQSSGQTPSTGRIPRDVLNTWSKMGIDVSDDKTLSRMVKNRERLADKGILPPEPAYGRVV
jgi:hypothetical protein